jgi:hypothetical protein
MKAYLLAASTSPPLRLAKSSFRPGRRSSRGCENSIHKRQARLDIDTGSRMFLVDGREGGGRAPIAYFQPAPISTRH